MAQINHTSKGNENTGSGTSLSFSHDASGDTLLLATISTRGNVSGMAATFNGVSMTLIAGPLTCTNGAYAQQWVFKLESPAQGSYTLAFSWSGGAYAGAAAGSYSNIGTIGSITQATGSLSISPTLASGDMVVGLYAIADTEASILNAMGQTDDIAGAASNQTGSGINHNTGVGSVALSATYNNGEIVHAYLILTAGSTQYDQSIDASVAISVSMLTPKTILQAMTATVTNSASVSMIKDFVRTLGVTATATASVLKGLAKTIGATASITAEMTAERVFLVTMNAITTASAEMTKVMTYARTLGVTATATASIAKQIALNIALTATSTIEATIAAGRTVIMNATTTVTATLASAIGKTLDATVSIVAKISAPFWRTKYPAHGDEEDYDIKYPHE